MKSIVSNCFYGLTPLQWLAGLACALTCAVASGAVLTLEESRSSRILYFEESGGVISAASKPLPGGAREPMPPIPPQTPQDGKAAPVRPLLAVVSPTPRNAKPKSKR